MSIRMLSYVEQVCVHRFLAKVDELAIRDELQPELREMLDDVPVSVMLWVREKPDHA